MPEMILPLCSCAAHDVAHVHVPPLRDGQYGLAVTPDGHNPFTMGPITIPPPPSRSEGTGDARGEALEKCMAVLRWHLSAFQRKDEPMMLTALEAGEAALGRREKLVHPAPPVSAKCCACGYDGPEETPCPAREDGHCDHWWDGAEDGEALCECGRARDEHGGPYGEGACEASRCESFAPAPPSPQTTLPDCACGHPADFHRDWTGRALLVGNGCDHGGCPCAGYRTAGAPSPQTTTAGEGCPWYADGQHRNCHGTAGAAAPGKEDASNGE